MLQPLNLRIFVFIKVKYRSFIHDLFYLDDAALIKKYRFVQYYKKTYKNILTSIIIKNGWRAAGVVPYNSFKRLNLSQLQIQPSIDSIIRP